MLLFGECHGWGPFSEVHLWRLDVSWPFIVLKDLLAELSCFFPDHTHFVMFDKTWLSWLHKIFDNAMYAHDKVLFMRLVDNDQKTIRNTLKVCSNDLKDVATQRILVHSSLGRHFRTWPALNTFPLLFKLIREMV